MGKSDENAKIGAALRMARKQRGKVLREVAQAAGVKIGAVTNWERGENAMAFGNLVAVANFLRIDPTALSAGEVRYLDDSEPLSEIEIVSDPGPAPAGAYDVRLLGTTVGGDDGDFEMNGEVAGFVRRPAAIASYRNVFALHVFGSSMEPRYMPGDLVYCGGRAPVPGDDVVIETFPEKGSTVGKAYIKTLVRREKGKLICSQFNPVKQIEFDAYALKAVHRVIPCRELLA